MSDKLNFHSFSGTKHSSEEIAEDLKKLQTNEVSDYASKIYCNGGCVPMTFRDVKNEKNVKKFLSVYQQIAVSDSKIQKECFAKYSGYMDQINEDLLKQIFEQIRNFVLKTESQIIFYGSSVCYFFPNAPYGFPELKISDIDVATDDSQTAEKLSAQIYQWLVDYGESKIYQFCHDQFRIKNVQRRTNDHKFFIRVDIMDLCQGKHFIGRLNLLDVSPKTPFLDRPQKRDLFCIQNPVSFFLGMYDKYASCMLNVNNLDQTQLGKTMEKMEKRFHDIQISSLDPNDLDYFADKFKHYPNCEPVKKMIQEALQKYKLKLF